MKPNLQGCADTLEQHGSSWKTAGNLRMRVLSKNFTSLLANDRFDLLDEELRDFEWDFLMCQETWRAERQEVFHTDCGHLFCGAGGVVGRSGTAVIVNERWRKGFVGCEVYSDRALVVHVDVGTWRLSFASMYFPHSGEPDMAVESQHACLQRIKRSCSAKRRLLLVGVDANARVGQKHHNDLGDVVGPYGYGTRNDRGEWFRNTCMTENLQIANTFFEKPYDSRWTYSKGDHITMIDYILLDRRLMDYCTDSGVDCVFNVGLEHQTVYAELCLRHEKLQRQRIIRERKCFSWSAEAVSAYSASLDERIQGGVASRTSSERYPFLESAMVDCARTHCMVEAANVRKSLMSPLARELIHKRQEARQAKNSQLVATYSKQLQKELRRQRRITAQSRIHAILVQRRGIRDIAGILNNAKRNVIPEIVDLQGSRVSMRSDIANAFADFFATLYDQPGERGQSCVHGRACAVNDFTLDEIQEQIRLLKNNRSCDNARVIAEMIKHAGTPMATEITQLFNDLLHARSEAPSDWYITRFRVLFKKGDQTSLENYRPIAIIPIFLKLLSRVIYARIQPILDVHQSCDQAGFRSGYSCDDHLFTLNLLIEGAEEWRTDLWLATVDFRKAFDCVNHGALWQALAEQGVPEQLLALIRRLYTGQQGIIALDVDSKTFPILRGTKQGDPLSSLLFISVLEHMMRPLKRKWTARGYGFDLNAHDDENRYLQNLRFADDLILAAKSKTEIVDMLTDLADGAATVGLSLHFGKTVVLSNTASQAGVITVRGQAVKLLAASDSADYLGRSLCLADPHTCEIRCRVRKAWAKFHALRQVLCGRAYPLRHRMALFEQVISPTLTYGSASWTMTANRADALTSAQRRMLRSMIAMPKFGESLEEFVDWVRTATHTAEHHYFSCGGEAWIVQQKRRYWKWAGHVARMSSERWPHRLLYWQPSGGSRRQGRPVKRWTDDIDDFFARRMGGCRGDWIAYAADRENWRLWEDDFALEH